MTDAEWALAGALGVAVGAATFYLARIWLQREPLSEGPSGLAERQAELAVHGAEGGLAVPEPDVEVETEGAERPLR